MKMKLTVPCVALALGAFMLTGCGADSNVKATASPTAQTGKEPNAAAKAIAAAPKQVYTGRYIGSGGGGAIPQVQALLDAYAHPEMTWQLSDVGSDAGLTLVQQGDLVDRDAECGEPQPRARRLGGVEQR